MYSSMAFSVRLHAIIPVHFTALNGRLQRATARMRTHTLTMSRVELLSGRVTRV